MTTTPLVDGVTLPGGVTMPRLGFGTWKVTAEQDARRVVRDALEVGYRHLDTAAIYRNETDVGAAVRDSGLPRRELFVTTKCWTEDLRAGRVIEACDASLDRLGMDYVDLYLLHWAVGDLAACWAQMIQLREQGKARAIGVSNYMVEHLRAIEGVGVTPAVNQIEFHPYLQSPPLVALCRERGITVVAWQPLMAGRVADVPQLVEIGRVHGKTAAQVALRWALQRGVVVIPKTTRRERMIENAAIFDFELTDDQMRAIDALDRDQRHGADPRNVTF